MYQKDNYTLLKISNIPIWDEAGYTGSRIKAVAIEGGTVDSLNKDAADHARTVEKVAKEISCPDGVFVMADKPETYKFILDNNIKLINISQTGVNYDDLLEECIKAGAVVVFAAGNSGDKLSLGALPNDRIAVGAEYVMYNCVDGELKRQNYSAIGLELDCMGLIPFIPTADGGDFQPNGTSFSAPYVCFGIIRRFMDLYLDKTGGFPTFQQVYDFMKSDCIDLETPGFDNGTGYGLFVLPKTLPYIKPVPKTVIVLHLDDCKYSVNGIEKVMDTAPEIDEHGRTEVPIRFVAEALGATVDWDANSRKITITK